MAVGTDHHTAGEGVVLKYHLVDDACAGLPEAYAVFVGHRLQEVEHLIVAIDGRLQVLIGADSSLDQVVAVYRRRHCRLSFTGLHELQQGHLCGGVLHGHTVGSEVHVAAATGVALGGVALPKVVIEDFLGQCEGLANGFARLRNAARHPFVHGSDHVDVKSHKSEVISGRSKRSMRREFTNSHALIRR